jgi:hypothetical protein
VGRLRARVLSAPGHARDPPAIGYRAPHGAAPPAKGGAQGRVVVLTGGYAAPLLGSLLATSGFADVEVLAVANRFFGGNIAVAGLLCGQDVASAIASDGAGATYLLPDSCVTNARFLDGTELSALEADVRVVEADGASLRRELESLSARR